MSRREQGQNLTLHLIFMPISVCGVSDLFPSLGYSYLINYATEVF